MDRLVPGVPKTCKRAGRYYCPYLLATLIYLEVPAECNQLLILSPVMEIVSKYSEACPRNHQSIVSQVEHHRWHLGITDRYLYQHQYP